MLSKGPRQEANLHVLNPPTGRAAWPGGSDVSLCVIQLATPGTKRWLDMAATVFYPAAIGPAGKTVRVVRPQPRSRSAAARQLFSTASASVKVVEDRLGQWTPHCLVNCILGHKEFRPEPLIAESVQTGELHYPARVSRPGSGPQGHGG